MGTAVRNTRTIALSALVLTGLMVLPMASLAQGQCAGSNPIWRLGNRATAFSEPIPNLADLQGLFRDSRADIENLLTQVGWAGEASDLFAAVSSGAGVSTVSAAPGTRMAWMLFRRRSAPMVKLDVCWNGKESFEAYQFDVTSNGMIYTFLVPTVCGNITLLREKEVPEKVVRRPPKQVCKISLRNTCQQFSIDARGSHADVAVEIQTPSGARRLTSSDANSPLRWSFKGDDRTGTYRFSVVSSQAGQCRAEDRVTLSIGAPSVRLSASSTQALVREEVRLTATPTVDECAAVSQVTLDGTPLASPYSRQFAWPEPGSYTVAAMVTDDTGQTANAELSVEVTRSKKTRSTAPLTLRPFVGQVDADATVRQSFSNFDARNYLLEGGFAAGLEAEYQFRERLGVAFGLLWSSADLKLFADRIDAWENDDANLEGFTLFGGPVFHLSPGNRADFFLGPLVGYTFFSDVDLRPFENTIVREFDDEFSFGAQLGLDLPFSRDGGWGLYVGLMWFDLDASSPDDSTFPFQDSFTLALDPLILNLGLSFEF